MKKSSQSTSIKVACRLRPLNQLELSTGGACCVTYTDKSIKVKVTGEENSHDFTFDHVFGPEAPQSQLYDKVAKPVLTGLMEGYNGTVFAYGQTSSGKTFTMEGPDIVDTEEKKGIIPRMMSHLFELIMNSSANIEFNVKVSFLELYNEKLHDLFDPRKQNLQIKEDKTKGIFVQDVTEIYVTSPEQMRQVHKKGAENRTIAATRMNERSSRSHSIFILNLIQKDISTDASKHSKLYFVDLAGSEKISKTHVTGQQLEEAKNINKSLSALGLVINALTEKKENVHVPYRDSKLTRLLQESLGGNSQTSLILACSMCSYNDKETLSTLRFGNRAKNIKNAPVMNVERSAKEYMMMLEASDKKIKDQEEIINRLQQQLDIIAQGGSISFPLAAPSEEEDQSRLSTEQLQVAGKEEKEIKREESTAATTTTNREAGQGSSSLTLLKLQIDITNARDELQELQKTNKELENELSTKNQEIYDLNGKVILYEHQLNELTTKNLQALENFRTKFDQISMENQEKSSAMNKFLRAITRLKSDLNFMYISKNLTMLDIAEKGSSVGAPKHGYESPEQKHSQQLNKEDLIINSIQKTIETLEEIERDLIEGDSKKSTTKETEALIEALLKDSKPSSTKKEHFGHQRSHSRTPKGIIGIAGDSTFNTVDEEIKLEKVTPFDSSSDLRESNDSIDSIKLDMDPVDFEDLTQRLQLMANDESKVAELQSLVTVQRKAITNLSKANAEMMQANQKSQQSQEKKIEGYASKISALEKTYGDKVKEYDDKIETFKRLLEEKIKENEEIKTKQDKDLLDKNKMISDLKYQTDRMQKIILGNDLPKRVFELENKIREVALERQNLFEEVFKLRSDLDEKDDLLSDKNSQIQLLQSNLNTLSTELEILKHFRPKQSQEPVAKKKNRHKDKNIANDNQTPQWMKDQMVIPEKHVIKPIRGGGGNVKNFERDNFLIFEKPTVLGDSSFSGFQRQGSLHHIRSASKEGVRGRRDDSAEDTSRKRSGTVEKQMTSSALGEMLKSEKGRKSFLGDDRIQNLSVHKQSISEKSELRTHEEIQNNARIAKSGKKEKDEQSSVGRLFSNMKSFFS